MLGFVTLKRKPCTTNSTWCTHSWHMTQSCRSSLPPPYWPRQPGHDATTRWHSSLRCFSYPIPVQPLWTLLPEWYPLQRDSWPPSSTTIDDELASLMSSSLNTLAITWDRIKVATASDINMVQSNLDYPDSLGLDEIVRIIEGPDNRKYKILMRKKTD